MLLLKDLAVLAKTGDCEPRKPRIAKYAQKSWGSGPLTLQDLHPETESPMYFLRLNQKD
jgi:hypothetical protein